MSKFRHFHLDEDILKALNKIGFEEPTPVQTKAIPVAMEGRDLIVSAQTGTGKTAAFMLPSLHMLINNYKRSKNGPKILVLVPTRELAMQVEKETQKYCKLLKGVRVVSMYGGVPYFKQKKTLSRPYDILVSTPGRLIDTMDQGKIDLSQVEMLILDEADRMLDMGFTAPVEQIVSEITCDHQTLLFSATLDKRVFAISGKFQENPFEIRIEPCKNVQNKIEKKLYYADSLSHKVSILDRLLDDQSFGNGIVFTSTKRQADQLSRDLRDKGHKASAIHGDLNQRQRTRTINGFRQGSIDILVATDVAARGIDIPALSHVINFDLPFHPEDFIHRIGRTGRAGQSGIAITLAASRDGVSLMKIETLLGSKMPIFEIEGLEPKTKALSMEEPKKGRKRGPYKGRRKSQPQQEFKRNGTPKREFGQDGPKRSFSKSGPKRDFTKKGPKREFGQDGPKREFGSKGPKREFGKNGPKREFGSKGPKREFGKDGPKREFSKKGPKRDFAKKGPRRDFGKGAPKGKRVFGGKPQGQKSRRRVAA